MFVMSLSFCHLFTSKSC